METVNRCYFKKKGWKGQQNEETENYWSSPNKTAKAELIPDSTFLCALEKCYGSGAHMLNIDLIIILSSLQNTSW